MKPTSRVRFKKKPSNGDIDFKKLNAINKHKLRQGRRIDTPATKQGLPYVKPKAKKRISFTEALRNKKGYAEYLANKPLGI